jgi:hypothetical protein
VEILVHQPDGESLQEEGQLVLHKPLGILQHSLFSLLLYRQTKQFFLNHKQNIKKRGLIFCPTVFPNPQAKNKEKRLDLVQK